MRGGSHAPVAGATIELQWRGEVLERATSTSDGRFQIAVSVPRERDEKAPAPLLVASALGTATLRAVLPGAAGFRSTDVGDLVLVAGGSVKGVVRGEDGHPVAEARLVLDPARPPDDLEHRAGDWVEVGAGSTATSDAQGQFEFSGVPLRPFLLEVKAPGHVSAWFQGEARREETWIDVRVRRGQSVHVSVLDVDGRPAPGARVNLYAGFRSVMVGGGYKTHVRLDRSTVANANGQCTLTGLSDRNYQITAQHKGAAGVAGYVLPGWTDIVIRLTPGWRSTRYVYERGPGGRRFGTSPPDAYGEFLWRRERPVEPEPDPEPDATAAADDPEETSDVEPPEPRPAPPSDTARLVVAVFTADGVAMPDAYFELKGPERESGITEDDGTEIVNVEPGRYTYRVSPIDFGTAAADARGTVNAVGGTEARLEVRMPLVYSLPLRVVDADGEPVHLAQLEIERSSKTKRTWTSADGTETIFVERGQPLRVAAVTGGPVVVLDRVTLPVRARVTLRVPPSLRIRGRVLGPGGTPEFGTRVRAVRQGLGELAEETWRGWTDDQGNFDIEGPAVGRYEVRAEHVAYGAGVTTVDVKQGLAPITLKLGALSRFRGRLLDSSGSPVRQAEIAIASGGRGWVGSDDDGRFEMAFPGGSALVELAVTHRDFAPLHLTVVPGRDRARDIRLSRGATLTVVVRGSKGRRIDLEILAADADRVMPTGDVSSEKRDDGVVFTVERAPAGAHRVRLARKEGEPRVLPYDAAEGASVTLQTTFE